MTEADRIKYLRIALLVVGLIFIFGLWPLTMLWPSGWSWHAEGRSEYLEMILGIYATLGVCLIIASRNPMAHRSLIWFGLVEYCAWCVGGSSYHHASAHWASVGRCFGRDYCGGRVGSADPTSESSGAL